MTRLAPQAAVRTEALIRAALTGLLVVALVVSSAFSIHARCFATDHAATVQAFQSADCLPGEQPCGDVTEAGCHCAQHLGGVIMFAPFQLVTARADRVVATLPPTITSPPAAPHPPPIG